MFAKQIVFKPKIVIWQQYESWVAYSKFYKDIVPVFKANKTTLSRRYGHVFHRFYVSIQNN